MNVQREYFDQRDVEQYCMGAGIIPISVCPRTNVPHLLLGRERWIPSWKGSCRWSGFEGSRKECESTRMSAAREFVEESMGCARLCPTPNRSYDRIRDVITKLDAGNFWKRIVLRIDTERRIERYHTTFLVPVPWSEEPPKRFFDARMEVEQVDRLVQEWNYMRPLVVGELGEVIGPIEFHDDGTVTLEKSIETSPCILRRPWKRVDGVLRATVTDQVEINQIRRWCELRERVSRAVAHCTHPCVTHERDERWRIVQTVRINSDHLEKDQIRWWSIDELDAVIDGHGQVGADRFRPYFIPVLQTALNVIHDRMDRLSWSTTAPEEREEDHQALSTLCEQCEEDPSAPTTPDALPDATVQSL